jgi:fructose-bisphosphate aldolase class 1
VENVEDNRRILREMLFRADGISNHISGVVSV